MEQRPLPEPDSEELHALIGLSAGRRIYEWLYRRRDNPPTMREVRMFMADALGEDQEHVGRRLRELRRHFDIAAVPQPDGEPRYELRGWSEKAPPDPGGISRRLRAQVLAPQRCAQCGRSPLTHGVVLQVDHKIPLAWGGTNEPENLQPLCEDCNHGKRDYYRTYEAHADAVRAAIGWDEPQKRIGELLKAFGTDEWVPSELLGLVASAKEYQEDWQRRLRDLRFLGWEYEHQNRHNEGARVRSYYRLRRWLPWPADVRAAISSEERRRQALKSTLSATDLS